MPKNPGVLVYTGTRCWMCDNIENVGTYKHETFAEQLGIYIIVAIASVAGEKVCYVLGERKVGWVSWSYLFAFGAHSDSRSQ